MVRALIRPGRLEEHIILSLPSKEQRLQFLIELFGAKREWDIGCRSDNDTNDDGKDEANRNLLNSLEQCADLTSNR
jgi:SpoVK/Ycf46/Vps4 family AAA+-type ATPase